LNPSFIVPSVFDPDVTEVVADAVRRTVQRKPDSDPPATDNSGNPAVSGAF
jgi:hypothetical protein